jgi:hypothetical protein
MDTVNVASVCNKNMNSYLSALHSGRMGPKAAARDMRCHEHVPGPVQSRVLHSQEDTHYSMRVN